MAKSDYVLDMVRRDPGRVPELVELTQDRDWLVTMRAMDLLEKLAHERPDLIAISEIGPLANSDKCPITNRGNALQMDASEPRAVEM